jgi:regulatory protein
MHITDITPTKRGRWSVFVDGEFYGVLHSDVYVRSRLTADCEVPQPELDGLLQKSGDAITRERALNLLSARAYTAQGLYGKLLAYTDEETAASAVRRMMELGLLDDLDYARRYAADCVNLKGYSYSRTRQALRQKGIAKEVIGEAMEDMGEDAETLIARAVRKRYLKYLPTEKGRKKTIDALVRRGFFYADVRGVVENLSEDPDYYGSLEAEDEQNG